MESNNHDRHSRKWMVDVAPADNEKGKQLMCLACIVEVLEDSDVLMIRKKPALKQLMTLLNSCNTQCVQLLQSDIRITAHVTLILLG